MLNFYRPFLPQAAATQAPLHDVLSGPRIKGSHPVAWTPELHKAFEECKASLSRASFAVAHATGAPRATAKLALVTDASTSAMGAVMQQRVDNAWQPLVFLSKKLNPAQQKYSAYDRELLDVYEALKHFCHVLEARHFIIFTDHKPNTYAFQQKPDKCSPRQFNHLDFIAQFTTDIRHISGQDNVVADALSRVESITAPPSHDALATSQDSNNELRTLLARGNKFPAPQSPSTVTHLLGSLGRTFLLPYGSKCSSPSTICHMRVLKLQRSWSHNVSCGRACRRIAAPAHGLAKPPSAPKFPATQLLQCETLRCRQPVSFTSISTSRGHFQRQWATHTASLQLTASHTG
jgi:hypothetical protein